MENADDLQRCGIGIRGVAMTIDSFVWLALFLVAGYAIGIPTGQVEQTADGTHVDLEGTLGTIAFLAWLALGIGYHALFEWQYGKTLGKYLVDIRAVEADGTQLSLRSSLVRNVLRIVDWLPLFYVVGILAIATSEEDERLGDRWSGTAVVRS